VLTNLSRPVPKTFYNIQILRGLASCMVVLFHSSEKWSIAVTGGDSMSWFVGASGVDIFFVISGFVMAMSALNKEDGPRSALKFLERRLVRILPLYWFITTALVLRINLGFLRNAVWTGPVPFPYTLCSYLLLPYRHGTETSPLVGQGWTLSYEMFFYLLFAVVLAMRKNVPIFLTLVLGSLVVIGSFQTEHWPAVTVLLRPMLLEFLAGLWLGVAILKQRFLSPAICCLLGASAVLTLLFLHPAGWVQRLEWGICAVLILQAAVALESFTGNRIPRWLLFIGDASYSIYLAHPMLLEFYSKRLQAAHVLVAGRVRWQDETITILVCLLLSLAAGFVTYLCIELPMNRYLQRLLHVRSVQTTSSAMGT
jgi:exopolysaccharide production protein ExoZ